jgi:hypothetical protein
MTKIIVYIFVIWNLCANNEEKDSDVIAYPEDFMELSKQYAGILEITSFRLMIMSLAKNDPKGEENNSEKKRQNINFIVDQSYSRDPLFKEKFLKYVSMIDLSENNKYFFEHIIWDKDAKIPEDIKFKEGSEPISFAIYKREIIDARDQRENIEK